MFLVKYQVYIYPCQMSPIMSKFVCELHLCYCKCLIKITLWWNYLDGVNVLSQVQQLVYASSSILVWGDKSITSAEGVQLGDPRGPLLLFYQVLHQLSSYFRSNFQVDDFALGGNCGDLIHDIQVMKDAEK